LKINLQILKEIGKLNIRRFHMKTLVAVLSILLLTCIASAQTYQIDWYVIGSGGGHSESGTYGIDGTIGQPIVGVSSSASYRIESGFWVGAGAPSGYEYLPGDVNMSGGNWPPSATGPDVTYLVNFFRGVPTSHSCRLSSFWCSADANGDCNIIGSDVTKLVNVFRGQGSISYCPNYEPAWHTPAELPPSAPSGWPNCEGVVVTSKSLARTGGSK
jgi:hypothetical protein